MEIKIITDSSCELPKDILIKNDIEMIPIPIMLPEEDKDYLDGVDITSKQMFEGMISGKVYTTSQVKLSSYLETFEKYYKNKEKALYLSLSSGLSSTYDTSQTAIKTLDEQYGENYVTTYDTKSASFGMGLLVYKIAQASKKGYDTNQLISIADKIRSSLVHLFSVTNLEYLYRGGRISKTSEVFGKILNVKPILIIDDDGKLKIIDKVKGNKKIIKYFVNYMQNSQKESDSKISQAWISHGMDEKIFSMMASALMDNLDFKEEDIISTITGSTIGAHTGPGSIYLFYLKKDVKF